MRETLCSLAVIVSLAAIYPSAAAASTITFNFYVAPPDGPGPNGERGGSGLDLGNESIRNGIISGGGGDSPSGPGGGDTPSNPGGGGDGLLPPGDGPGGGSTPPLVPPDGGDDIDGPPGDGPGDLPGDEVPEPATVLLLAIGFAGGAAQRFRRRRSSAR